MKKKITVEIDAALVEGFEDEAEFRVPVQGESFITGDGKILVAREGYQRIVLKRKQPRIESRWLNFYPSWVSYWFQSREEADMLASANRIACKEFRCVIGDDGKVADVLEEEK